ncbi:MAG: MGMT family protein [bacterium]
MTSNLFQQFYKIIARIPKGKVATYGQIARLAGRPGCARMVGWALHTLPDAAEVPWHRVINARGQSSFPDDYHRRLQQSLLEAEGVRFDEQGRIDLERFRW